MAKRVKQITLYVSEPKTEDDEAAIAALQKLDPKTNTELSIELTDSDDKFFWGPSPVLEATFCGYDLMYRLVEIEEFVTQENKAALRDA